MPSNIVIDAEPLALVVSVNEHGTPPETHGAAALDC
jgi:hypothetical protein